MEERVVYTTCLGTHEPLRELGAHAAISLFLSLFISVRIDVVVDFFSNRRGAAQQVLRGVDDAYRLILGIAAEEGGGKTRFGEW